MTYQKVQRITIDLDSYVILKYNLNYLKIIKKITHYCKYAYKFEAEPSPSTNGEHIIVWCKKENCPICRMVWDDTHRFEYDQRRPEHTQNVLFTTYMTRNVKL
jgi:hypothetical protein